MSLRLRLLLFYLNNFSKQLDYRTLTGKELRRLNEEELKLSKNIIDYPELPLHHVEDIMIPMRDKHEIRIRLYQPSEDDNLPVVIFYHGGGFVSRSVESHDKVCRRVAHLNQVLVISVDYRMAPEHKFPVPVHDCYDAALWISQNVSNWGGDPQKLMVMGDSAGGNLSTVVSILARNTKAFNINYQILIYPSTDARLEHPSIRSLGKGYLLSEDGIRWYLQQYQSSEEDILNPLMSPLLTEDMSNLPPTFLATAELDPLKDEGEAYANRLKEAGNAILFKEYPGVVHGFLNMPKITKQALTLHQEIHEFIQPILTRVNLEKTT